MKIAIYPGSFDPITLGHLDIIQRGAACFDKLYVCVMVNCEKKLPMFTPERRLELIRRSVANIPNVEVENWAPTSCSRACATPPTGTWSCKWPASIRASCPSWKRC